jgi:hypothetical protein
MDIPQNGHLSPGFIDPWVSVRHHIVHGDMDTAAIVQDLWVRAVSEGRGNWGLASDVNWFICTMYTKYRYYMILYYMVYHLVMTNGSPWKDPPCY